MSLMLNKNDLHEFLCKFKGHSLSDEDKKILRFKSPSSFVTFCIRCKCSLKLDKISETPSYIVAKIYDEEGNNEN